MLPPFPFHPCAPGLFRPFFSYLTPPSLEPYPQNPLSVWVALSAPSVGQGEIISSVFFRQESQGIMNRRGVYQLSQVYDNLLLSSLATSRGDKYHVRERRYSC